MASSPESVVAPMTVCGTCGDKGETEVLIYCVKCKDSAVHHYCMPNFSPNQVEILWTCEECAPRVDKIMNFRKSERISFREDRAVEVRRNWRKRLNSYSFSASERRPDNMQDGISKTTQETGDHSLTVEKMKRDQSFGETLGNQQLKNPRRKLILEDDSEGDSYEQFDYVESLGNQDLRKQRRLILEDEGDCDEQLDSIEVKSSPLVPSVQSNTSYSQSSLESDNYNYYAKPVIDSIWRGSFCIKSGKKDTLINMMAHLSSKAYPKVSDAATRLPSLLDLNVLAKCNAWPKSFRREPPTDESIALYFFPITERDEKYFDALLDDIVEHDLTLKAIIIDVELLIFSSLELPQQHWRFQREYYLWGVFKPKQYYPALIPEDNPVLQNSSAECVSSPKLTNPAVMGQTMNRQSFWIPLNAGTAF